MIRGEDPLAEEAQSWQDYDGKYQFAAGGIGAVHHPSDRSSFCSTCSSYDSEYSDDEDSISRWPWIPYIQEDGSLFFLEPYSEPLKEEEEGAKGAHRSKSSQNGEKKDESGGILRGFGRIKGALKRSTTFAKKDKDAERNGDEGNKDVENNNKTDHTEPSFDIQLIRKSAVVKVDKSLPVEIDMNCNLLEDIIGIISGLDLDPVQPTVDATANDNTVIPRRLNAIAIQGISQGSPADDNQDISIGDTLLAVNGVEVSQRNINYVLSKIRWPTEVILTIEKIVSIPAKPKVKSKIIDLITGCIDDVNSLSAYQETCAVMYLTLDSNEDDPEGDIVYWYPDSKYCKKLKAIRGMFLTIADLMNNVTGTDAKSSTLLIQDELIHVCYQKYGDSVLVIAAPDHKCSLFRLEQAVEELRRQMDFLYKSAEQAFLPEYKEDVHHLFVLFMERLLKGLPIKSQTEISNLTADHLNGVKYLQLPSEKKLPADEKVNFYAPQTLDQEHRGQIFQVFKKVWISSTLSDAEAADYGECADDFFPHRRLYTILGSCLFYKGHMVCNHLPDDDLVDCIVFCKHHCLLAMTEEQRVSQLVVWKEVYPVRRRSSQPSNKECFEEPSGRWFLLAVAQKHSLLAMLLEAGGASSTPEGSPGPHPYYVDTAASILAYIQEALDFETICEAKLRGSSVPAIASVNDTSSSRQNQSNAPLEITLRKLPAHLETMGMQNSPSIDSIKALARGEESPIANAHKMSSPFPSRSSESKTSDDSGSNNSSIRMSVSNLSSSSSPFKNNPPVNGENTSMLSTQLTAGEANTLFYYTSCDRAKGILLCPAVSCSDIINKDVLENFYKACDLIRRTFSRSSGSKSNGIMNGNSESSNPDRVYEQGLLFRRKAKKGGETKKSLNTLKYWVVGRRLGGDNSREFFVCFQDRVAQSVIELAFKFGFGTVI